MNDHDEIDTVRREFGALAGKVRDATVTAARWNDARLQQAQRAQDRSERARDRAAQRTERAIRLAERAQRKLHARWQAADRMASTDLAVELESARGTRAGQEQLVARWAWAQAHIDENPEAAQELDARLRAETGIDPEVLRNPLAAAQTSTEPIQPFNPIEHSAPAEESAEAAESAPTAQEDAGRVRGVVDDTVLDDDALIRGMIQAAHPSSDNTVAQSLSNDSEVVDEAEQQLSVSDVGLGE